MDIEEIYAATFDLIDDINSIHNEISRLHDKIDEKSRYADDLEDELKEHKREISNFIEKGDEEFCSHKGRTYRIFKTEDGLLGISEVNVKKVSE